MVTRIGASDLSSGGLPSVKARLFRKAKAFNGGLFFELNHDPTRSALVLGSGRSGTTWLAEALARQSASRLIFEPFHPMWSPGRSQIRLFLDPNKSNQSMKLFADSVIAGRLHKRQIDHIVSARLPRSRIVKDIHTTNLLPWYSANYPRVPIVFIVRHPIATALSRQRFGSFFGLGAYLETPSGRREAEQSPVSVWLPVYDVHRSSPNRVVSLVAEWCIENVYPLTCARSGHVTVTFYESAVLTPVAEFTRLAEFCSGALGSPKGGGFRAESVRKPSEKDWFGTAAAAQKSRDWNQALTRWTSEVPEETIKRCLEVMSDFGMDAFYGAEPMPKRQVDDALAGSVDG
jgi:hypothetical protein